MSEQTKNSNFEKMGKKFSFHLNSSFIRKNQKEILLALEKGKKLYENDQSEAIDNITWHYKNYNIFNLCLHSQIINQLQTLLHDVIRLYLNDFEMKHEGFSVTAWLNYHTKINQLLKTHTHESLIHGYINIDPLKSRTVMSDFFGNDLFSVDNEVGLIYMNQPNAFNLHRVEVHSDFVKNEELIRPRVTIAFDVDILPRPNNYVKEITPHFSTYAVFR